MAKKVYRAISLASHQRFLSESFPISFTDLCFKFRIDRWPKKVNQSLIEKFLSISRSIVLWHLGCTSGNDDIDGKLLLEVDLFKNDVTVINSNFKIIYAHMT